MFIVLLYPQKCQMASDNLILLYYFNKPVYFINCHDRRLFIFSGSTYINGLVESEWVQKNDPYPQSPESPAVATSPQDEYVGLGNGPEDGGGVVLGDGK